MIVQLQHHIESIYEKALAPTGCESLLDQLVTELEFRSGGFYLEYLDRSSFQQAYRFGGTDSEHQTYHDYYYETDVWGQKLTALPYGQFHMSEKYMTFRELQKTEFYDGWLREIDMHYATGCYFPGLDNQGFRISFQHTKDQGSLAEKNLHLNQLAPHITRAFSLRGRLNQSEGLAANLAAIIDLMPEAAFAVNEVGSVLYRNAQSEPLFETSKMIRLVNEKLVFNHPLRVSLESLIRNSVFSAQGIVRAPKQTTLRLRNTDGTAEYEIRVEPHNGADFAFGIQYRRAMALVLIKHLPSQALPSPKALATQYRLTTRETELLMKLIQGHSLAEIAEDSHRSINTIKTHLRSVFVKTQTGSQHQLVAKVRQG